jgi:hypothetical protein
MNIIEHIQKVFNEGPKRTKKHGKDPLVDIMNDPNILAYTEMGKTSCM